MRFLWVPFFQVKGTIWPWHLGTSSRRRVGCQTHFLSPNDFWRVPGDFGRLVSVSSGPIDRRWEHFFDWSPRGRAWKVTSWHNSRSNLTRGWINLPWISVDFTHSNVELNLFRILGFRQRSSIANFQQTVKDFAVPIGSTMGFKESFQFSKHDLVLKQQVEIHWVDFRTPGGKQNDMRYLFVFLDWLRLPCVQMEGYW